MAMTAAEEKAFMEIVEREHIRVDVMDALRELISDISDAAFDRGVAAGAEQFNTSWPSSQSS